MGTVADYYSIRFLSSSPSAAPATSPSRQIAMYLARDLTESSLPEIGEAFGGRDHSTVIHAIEKIESELKLDPSLQSTITELISLIRRG